MPDELDQIQKMLQNGELISDHMFEPNIQIGGDPAISAIRGYMLRLGPTGTTLPLVCYGGVFPASVQNALLTNQVNESQEILNNVFRIRYPVNERPHSIGLESDVAKIIIIYGPGRSISNLAPEGNFEDFLTLIREEVLAPPAQKERVILAVNASRPEMITVKKQNVFLELSKIANEIKHPEMANEKEQTVSEILYMILLLREVKKTSFGDRVRTFVATRDFGKDPSFARQVLTLLKNADIISANDSEIHDLHTAFHNGDFENIPLAYKLRELPFNAMKVCHSADGVIMDLGCRPEHIITSKGFQDDPVEYLEEVLRLSADGATYAMDATSTVGRSANEAMIRIYSGNVTKECRQNERFRATFLNITEPMPAGMVSVASARVVRTLGAVVGLGAVFDGLLLSFLMRN